MKVRDTLQSGSTFLVDAPYAVSSTCGSGNGAVGTTNVKGDTDLLFTLPSVPAASGNTAGSCTITFWAQTSTTAAI